jgi:ArsR family transcriptional regulator
VATRRHGQAIYYRIADPAVQAVISTLAGIFCPPEPQETTHVDVNLAP